MLKSHTFQRLTRIATVSFTQRPITHLYGFTPRRAFATMRPDPFTDAPELAAKVQTISNQQPMFDRLVYFDPDYMAQLPYFLNFLDPMVEKSKDLMVQLHDATGLPWIGVIFTTCFIMRMSLLPLIYVQMKRASKLAAVSPVIIQVKHIMDKSKLPKLQRWTLFSKILFKIVRQQKLKTMRLALFNLVHFPLLLNLIWSIRRLLVEPSFANTSILWIPSLAGIDPYYVIPVLTISCYYWNLQRFITKENKHTLISRAKGVGQVLLILWLPILCNWPSAIAFYMLANSMFSIVQTGFLASPTFYRLTNPKMMLYQSLIRLVEHDKAQSQALIETIKTGEESYSNKAIKEEVLLEQTMEIIRNLNLQKEEKIAKLQEEQQRDFHGN